ncbi:MAG: M14 family metallopeptidase [Coriobacteriales bacterium]|nr:M14 family metallopeptidase [Coriobacteriales bacterium]
MIRGTIYQMHVPHREPMRIRGFEFGSEHSERSCAIIGSMRGNEVQQAFVCATLVSLLARIEQSGMIAKNKSVLIIPCVNPLSMNLIERFWPGDGADINRSFPGDSNGRSTERIAAAIMRVARLFTYGIQLCSFNQPGDFMPHVRITHQGPISQESLTLAQDFGLDYAMDREPTPFDSTTLNYVWQECGTNAFSLYSRATNRIDTDSAKTVTDAVLRFLARRQVIELPKELGIAAGHSSRVLRESELVDVRSERASGFFVSSTHAGDHVRAGQQLGVILDTMDAHLLESLASPVSGQVFFMRTDPLIQQHMVLFRIAPS